MPGAPSCVPTAVHPRECGERQADQRAQSAADGSSPRVRGTPGHDPHGPRPRRFIPASAGNACASWPTPPAAPVHPRECGERSAGVSTPDCVYGSSPRVRGTQIAPAARAGALRFIPASAGNAHQPPEIADVQTVHPRECGERKHNEWRRAPAYGSSPRVRGTPADCRMDLRFSRFIPASAGNAPHPGCWLRATAVHPRECGERAADTTLSLPQAGSSPRVRGTRQRRQRYVPARRFIPASAGNASAATTGRTSRPVHPRECGERGTRLSNTSFAAGSSPRVRGTRFLKLDSANGKRFIPASAGNAPI